MRGTRASSVGKPARKERHGCEMVKEAKHAITSLLEGDLTGTGEWLRTKKSSLGVM